MFMKCISVVIYLKDQGQISSLLSVICCPLPNFFVLCTSLILFESIDFRMWRRVMYQNKITVIIPPLHQRGGILFYLCLSVRPSVRRIFLSNYWWQKSDIWSQASYRYAILWEAFLDPSDSYFLFADLVGFYTHWTYMRGHHKWALAHSSSCFDLNSKSYHQWFGQNFVVLGHSAFIFCMHMY